MLPAPTPLHSSSRRALWTLFETEQSARMGSYLCKLARRGHANLLATFDDHPIGDDWKDFAFAAIHSHFARCSGTVYVVTNPVHVNLYKVGQTQGEVAERISSLNSAGVVGYFVPVTDVQVKDRFAVEAAVHRVLRAREGTQSHKEFFQCTWDVATEALREQVVRENAALAQFDQ